MKYTAQVSIKLKRSHHKSWESYAYVYEYQPVKNRLGRVLKPYGAMQGWTRVEGTEKYKDAATEAEALAMAIANARTYIRATRADNMQNARKVQRLNDDNDLYIVQLAQYLEPYKNEAHPKVEARVQKQLEADKRDAGDVPLSHWGVTRQLLCIWASWEPQPAEVAAQS